MQKRADQLKASMPYHERFKQFLQHALQLYGRLGSIPMVQPGQLSAIRPTRRPGSSKKWKKEATSHCQFAVYRREQQKAKYCQHGAQAVVRKHLHTRCASGAEAAVCAS